MEKALEVSAKEWVQNNQSLLHKHRGLWIAYNGEDGIIAHHKDAR